MSEMASIDSALHEILSAGLADWVPVDRVIACADEIAEDEGGGFRNFAIQIIELLIGQDLMTPGEIGNTGFEGWEGTPPELVKRVVVACESFHWEPFGEACWLANTEAGDARARGTEFL